MVLSRQGFSGYISLVLGVWLAYTAKSDSFQQISDLVSFPATHCSLTELYWKQPEGKKPQGSCTNCVVLWWCGGGHHTTPEYWWCSSVVVWYGVPWGSRTPRLSS
ncbi:hypothetical protein E2C01_002802 [Portunus trituberculatus]|uniref:Uncharacterized protein n=1 Tax=Portunus trituberculatus TaxID=210409 RepID=A0A5B7CKF3_PORTR|nr:hypothetical protein [Portunus trituberculatus]